MEELVTILETGNLLEERMNLIKFANVLKDIGIHAPKKDLDIYLARG